MQNSIYIDVNIILDYMFDARENSSNSRKFLREKIEENCMFVTNNLSLNIIFYIGAQQNKQYDRTKEFLKYIHYDKDQWHIYNLNKNDREFAFDFMDNHHGADFEDLLQYISAKNSRCGLIVTNDKNFPKIDISLKRTTPKIEDYNFMIK